MGQTPRSPITLEGLSQHLQDQMTRMKDLIGRRSRTWREDIPAIDEEMDQLCQEMADFVENSPDDPAAPSGLSTRLRRMARLVLEEMIEQRDKARQERRVDG